MSDDSFIREVNDEIASLTQAHKLWDAKFGPALLGLAIIWSCSAPAAVVGYRYLGRDPRLTARATHFSAALKHRQ